ncbi:unnamed protein product [Didymodactylos carnosus]|uniref:MULE transposase domain-containing protein n=1 Tax=Didymodactylos carnosus TaxID=1234261 RepID=A0A8S2FRG9_9BILA|nr:unnamed protein product [Didymodactylos carnosus]CAF4315244.1 unnamed protein product [Didymodactylos carnosus]
MKPMVFAAMPNKSRQSYEQLLRSLVSYAESLDVKLEPKSILIDFEQGAVQAFQTVFPGIQVKLCHFHFGQNIWKRIKKYDMSLEGCIFLSVLHFLYFLIYLVKLFKDEQARQQLADLLCLPLMPPEEVIDLFCVIVEGFSNMDDKLLKLK